MILYFSGTGNSLSVAEKLSALLNEQLVNIEKEAAESLELKADEALGIVFPVYAWGLPDIVTKYLRSISIGDRYVWSVMTCGDDMGYADEILEKVLSHRVDAAFSVQMPNTYVCLPGFDVDSPELAEKKKKDTEELLPGIAESITAREACRKVTRGGAAWLKTYVLRPLFRKFLVTDRYFKTNSSCNSCGLCAKQCPVGDICITSGHPVWLNNRTATGSLTKGSSCTGCLRCYHKCPKRAIEWGSFTKGKGSNYGQTARTERP